MGVNSKAFKFDDGLTCVTANYSMNTDGTIKVFNVGAKDSPTGTLSTAEGKATVTDSNSCKLGVKFSQLQPVNAPYQVWETDYETYSIVLSCIPLLNTFGQSAIWILSRTPQLPKDTLNGLLEKLQNSGFQFDDMRTQVQTTDCNYYKGEVLL